MSLAIGKRVRVTSMRPSLEGAEGFIFSKDNHINSWIVALDRHRSLKRFGDDELEVLE